MITSKEKKKKKKKVPTVASRQISRRKRGTPGPLEALFCFGAFASRRYIRRWGLLPLRHFDSEGTEISAFQPSSFFFFSNNT